MILFYKCLIYGLLVYFVQEALAIKCNVDGWNVDYYPSRTQSIKSSLTLECRRKYKLTDVEVVGGKDTYIDEKGGFRKTALYGKTPSLIAKIPQCYWSQTCSFAFPKGRMVTCVTINSSTGSKCAIVEEEEDRLPSCFFENVEYLRPVHAECIKARLVKNFCEKGKKKKVKCTNKFPKKQGMIKSHDLFPWYYDFQNVTHKYNFPLSKRKTLVIGIKLIHVCEDDRLTIRTGKNETNISDFEKNKHVRFTKKEHKFVELKFTVATDSMGCGGFLICYKAVKKNAGEYDGKKRHVCDDLYDKKMPKVTIKP